MRKRLRKLETLKSMGPEGMHSGALGELTDKIAKPLLITFEKAWCLRQVP